MKNIKVALISTLIIGYTTIIYHIGYGFGYDAAKSDLQQALNKNNELEKKLETAINDVRVETKIEYVDVIKTIVKKEKEYVYQTITLVPPQFDLSNGWVYMHDTAAEGGDADPGSLTDGTSSGVKDNQGLTTIVENYSTCRKNAEQLRLLQKFVNDSKDKVDQINKQ